MLHASDWPRTFSNFSNSMPSTKIKLANIVHMENVVDKIRKSTKIKPSKFHLLVVLRKFLLRILPVIRYTIQIACYYSILSLYMCSHYFRVKCMYLFLTFIIIITRMIKKLKI